VAAIVSLKSDGLTFGLSYGELVVRSYFRLARHPTIENPLLSTGRVKRSCFAGRYRVPEGRYIGDWNPIASAANEAASFKSLYQKQPPNIWPRSWPSCAVAS